VLLAFASGLALMAFAWSGIDAALAIVVPMFFFMFGVSLVIPHAMAAAMEPFPELAGTASSLIGLAQLSAGAGISYVLGVLFDGTARPMTGAIALASLVSVFLYEGLIGRSQPQPARTPPP
jgi:DHA1 family bicyclomycin/chloramphenicol resistance-like MFS transporter